METEVKCSECRGACCEYYSLPIAGVFPPTNGDAIQHDINRWLMLHGKIDIDQITFECKCTQLGSDGLCLIYEQRPVMCRNFDRAGPECLATVRERRTEEDYSRIREEDDPETLYPE